MHSEGLGANDEKSWLFGACKGATACSQHHPCFPVNTSHFIINLLFPTPNNCFPVIPPSRGQHLEPRLHFWVRVARLCPEEQAGCGPGAGSERCAGARPGGTEPGDAAGLEPGDAAGFGAGDAADLEQTCSQLEGDTVSWGLSGSLEPAPAAGRAGTRCWHVSSARGDLGTCSFPLARRWRLSHPTFSLEETGKRIK